MKFFFRKIFVLLLVIFLNPWIWRILKYNLFIGLLVIGMSVVLFKFIQKENKRLGIILYILFIILSSLILITSFDRSLITLSPAEIAQLNQRHNYYAKELGPLFLNRRVLNFYQNYNPIIYKFERNLFSNLDFNLYFFASHPRERAGIDEFEKYLAITVPFFIIGLLLFIYNGSLRLLFYFLITSIVSGLISPSYYLGPILFFPLVTSIITLGIIFTLKYFRLWKNGKYSSINSDSFIKFFLKIL